MSLDGEEQMQAQSCQDGVAVDFGPLYLGIFCLEWGCTSPFNTGAHFWVGGILDSKPLLKEQMKAVTKRSQQILDSRIRRGQLQYLVRWTGYPIMEASWVGESDVQAPQLLRRFHR